MSRADIEKLAGVARRAWLDSPDGAIDALELWIFQIRAILTAMREPSEEALIAGLRALYPHNLYAWDRLPPQRQTELLSEMRNPWQAVLSTILDESQ